MWSAVRRKLIYHVSSECKSLKVRLDVRKLRNEDVYDLYSFSVATMMVIIFTCMKDVRNAYRFFIRRFKGSTCGWLGGY